MALASAPEATDSNDPALPMLALLRKHKARIAEYEQIVSEGQAALDEARRTFAITQRRIAAELGLELGAEAAPAPGPAKPRWHRKSYKLVLAALEQFGADSSKNLAARCNITEGAASGACHRLVRDGKAVRVGKGLYQVVSKRPAPPSARSAWPTCAATAARRSAPASTRRPSEARAQLRGAA